MANLSFTILGSSAGMPQPGRVNSGYTLDIDGRLIQFDCGGGISSAFRRAGYDPLAVERVFVSHTHADHVSDLPLFVQMIHLAGRESGRRTSIEIYLPGEAVDAVEAYLRAAYLHPEKLSAEYRLLPVPEDGAVEFDGGSVLPIRNGHLKANADLIAEYNWKNRMQCYSYLIRSSGKSILYSADLGSESELFPYLKGLDLLVVESTHIDIGNLLDRAAENDVGKIILTHFEEGYDIDRALGMSRKRGMDNLIIATDGMRVEL